MIDKRRRLSWPRSIVLASLALGTSGCSEELGPERMIVTPIKGIVRHGHSPVSAGWIEFVPVEGTVGKLRTARIRSDGSFEADQVAVGVNLIRLANAPMGSIGAERLFGSYRSPIRRMISVGSTAPLVIDVVDESILFKNSQARITGLQARGSGEPR